MGGHLFRPSIQEEKGIQKKAGTLVLVSQRGPCGGVPQKVKSVLKDPWVAQLLVVVTEMPAQAVCHVVHSWKMADKVMLCDKNPELNGLLA